MTEPGGESETIFRNGAAEDAAACVALWVTACASRDGAALAGVAERARPKFDSSECWIVAEDVTAGTAWTAGTVGIVGFVLATKPGTGLASDPPHAPVIGLLAVAPGAQGRGLGGILLAAVTTELVRRGHEQSVLHVLADHHVAVRLYESNGWRTHGEPFQHSLWGRPAQAYVLDLPAAGAAEARVMRTSA